MNQYESVKINLKLEKNYSDSNVNKYDFWLDYPASCRVLRQVAEVAGKRSLATTERTMRKRIMVSADSAK